MLAICLASACLVGCKKDDVNHNDPNVFEVFVYSAGYGHQWCIDLLDAFQEEEWVKEKYPELTVKFTKGELNTQAGTYLSSGRANPYEIIFGQNLQRYQGPGEVALDITEEVYNSYVPGEDIKVVDKLTDSARTSFVYRDVDAVEDSYYLFPYADGMTGIVYNETRLNKLGFSVPNTTDELLDILAQVKALGGTNPDYPYTYSFVSYGSSPYVVYLINALWAQYEGYDNYVNFFNGIDGETGARSSNIFLQQGRLEALKFIEEIMPSSLGYTNVNADPGRSAFMDTQTRLILGNGLFMANGDWFDNEMRAIYDGLVDSYGSADTIKMMKTPVLSSIRNKKGVTTIPDDATLSKIVAAVDADVTWENRSSELSSVNAKDWETVRAARKVIYSIGPGHNGVIPKHAAGKEIAVDFLRYMATDKALSIYMKATLGASLPFKYDVTVSDPELYDSFAPFQKDRIAYFNTGVDVLPSESSFPLVTFGTLQAFASAGGNPVSKITTGYGKGNYSSVAERIFQEEYGYWTANGSANWNLCLQTAGL